MTKQEDFDINENNNEENNNQSSNENNTEPSKDENIEENKISELEKQVSDLKNSLLRYAADAENARRRAEQEVTKAHAYGIEKFAKDMVEVLENLYRALDTLPATAKDGVVMTKDTMEKALNKHGITRIFPKNEKFDHNLHQAISQIEQPDVESGIVIDVVQAGYVLNNRSIKPAMVVVAK